jgi:hypothetical protein
MKIKQSFCLREDQLDSLKQLSQKTGAPMAELIRRAIDAYMGLQRSSRHYEFKEARNAPKSAA